MDGGMTTQEIFNDDSGHRGLWLKLRWFIFKTLVRDFFPQHRWIGDDGVVFYAGKGSMSGTFTWIRENRSGVFSVIIDNYSQKEAASDIGIQVYLDGQVPEKTASVAVGNDHEEVVFEKI